MAYPRIFTPENRLASILGGAGGQSADELTRNAEERLATLKESITDYVAGKLATIKRIASEPEEIIFAECQVMGDAALAICEVAAVAGQAALGDVARGISAMVGALISDGVWHTEALMLHIEALAMIAGDSPPSPAQTAKILARLEAMREWIGVPN
jgi:hypothetical protein